MILNSHDYSFKTSGRVSMVLAIIFSSIYAVFAIFDFVLYLATQNFNGFSKHRKFLLGNGSIKLVLLITLLLLSYFSKQTLERYKKILKGLASA